ncbi:MAG: BLUF domain-containing protein [Kangiellaceae bacterium]|jgi:hypothetical protein|nr:BLUF domain-containing protein [Kangiellaceae bacterium]
MISFTYVSEYTGTPDEQLRDLQSIYDASLVNNLNRGITGALIYCNNHFLQTLEGDEYEVKELFSIISADTRHKNVVSLFNDQTIERMYPEWNMQPINLDREELFTSENLKKIKAIIERNIQVDSITYHELLRQVLDNPKITDLIIARHD